MSALSRPKVLVCPECGEQIERLYIPRGHYHGDPGDVRERRFVKAEEVEVIPVDSLYTDEALLHVADLLERIASSPAAFSRMEAALDVVNAVVWASKEEQ
jgi:hypothetical protein